MMRVTAEVKLGKDHEVEIQVETQEPDENLKEIKHYMKTRELYPEYYVVLHSLPLRRVACIDVRTYPIEAGAGHVYSDNARLKPAEPS